MRNKSYFVIIYPIKKRWYVIISDKYLVGLDEYKILNSENPVGYTRDIHSCIICIFHRKEDSILMHIEAYDNMIELENFFEVISKSKNLIENVDIFKGKYTLPGNLSIIRFVLNKNKIKYKIHDVFTNKSNETSVGYNYNTNDYYMASMEKGVPKLIKKQL